ncbi:MAG: stage II sporulation protein M [Candidatus Aenigmatarchaeota archaeon]
MLEFVFSLSNVERKPLMVFLAGVMITIVSFLIASFIMPSEAGWMTIFFITITAVPFFTKMFVQDESIDKHQNKPSFFRRHEFVLKTYTLFFLSIVLGLSMIYHFAPADVAGNTFGLQTKVINEIRAQATSPGEFWLILANNAKVSILSFLLSVIFGAGAILVLAWNASIIAVFIGNISRGLIPLYSSLGPAAIPISYAHGLPIALFSIFLHGVPEITSYFLSGLAGGIISVALIREKFGSPEFNRVVNDGLSLLAVSLALVAIAAFLESPPF